MPGNFSPDSYSQTVGQMGATPTGGPQLQQNIDYHTGLQAQAGQARRDIDTDVFHRRLRMRKWMEDLQQSEIRSQRKYAALSAVLGMGSLLPYAFSKGDNKSPQFSYDVDQGSKFTGPFIRDTWTETPSNGFMGPQWPPPVGPPMGPHGFIQR